MKVGLLYSAIMTCLVWAGTPACSIAACTEVKVTESKALLQSKKSA